MNPPDPEAGPEVRRPRSGARSRQGSSWSDEAGARNLGIEPRRYGRYVALLAIVILVLITINTVLTKPNGARGIAPGQTIPPFAVPLALGSLKGDADIATVADQGAAGRVPACDERGPQILNICQLYERRPVVLALFVNGGSCTSVLSDMQALAPAFPGVSFAAVAVKGERRSLLALMRERGLSKLQVGFDSDGALPGLYKMASCPQVTFVLPGGVVQSPALLSTPSRATLRARVSELVAAAKARDSGKPSQAAESSQAGKPSQAAESSQAGKPSQAAESSQAGKPSQAAESSQAEPSQAGKPSR